VTTRTARHQSTRDIETKVWHNRLVGVGIAETLLVFGKGRAALGRTSGIELEGAGEEVERYGKIIAIERVGDAHLITSEGTIGIETCSGCDHESLVIVAEIGEQPFAELLGIVDWETGYSVESAARHGGVDTRNLIETIEEEIAALAVLTIHLDEILVGHVERGHGGNLTESRGAEARLCELESRIDDSLVARGEQTDAETALTVTFGDGIDHDDIIIDAVEIH